MLPLVRKTESGVASHFADLQGLQDLPAPKRVEVLPYVVGRGHYDTPDSPRDPFDHGSVYLGNLGADLKYGVSSNLTLDATVNPDFGQVALDPAFVNLSAFEVQLEEKRPFFVEGGNIFGFAGNGNGLAKLSDRPQYFYSRRIGQPAAGGLPGGFAVRRHAVQQHDPRSGEAERQAGERLVGRRARRRHGTGVGHRVRREDRLAPEPRGRAADQLLRRPPEARPAPR